MKNRPSRVTETIARVMFTFLTAYTVPHLASRLLGGTGRWQTQGLHVVGPVLTVTASPVMNIRMASTSRAINTKSIGEILIVKFTLNVAMLTLIRLM